MSIFILETEPVTSSAETIDTLSTQVSDLSSSVNGYDVSCDDGDLSSAFANAKGVIAGNLDACSIKISNTSAIMNSVVSSHTTLQNNMKFQSSEEKAEAAKKAAQSQPSSSSSSYGSRSSGSYPGSYSSGSYPGSSSSGGRNNSSSPSATPEREARKPVDVNAKVTELVHDKVQTSLLTDLGKELFENKDLVYNAAGYATIGGMFIIACSKEYGNVGDEIEITLKDGQKFKCIIGQIDDNVKDKLKFFVNDSWKEDGEENFQKELGDYITKIQNLGQNVKYTIGTTVNNAIEWAQKTAADNTHGYSQSTRWGNPNYDCSSFVISSYEAAGIKVKEAGASYTGNMRKAFLKAGFEWIPGTPDVNKLQPGDVLLNEGTHTEMYIGNGKMIGAHSNNDGRDGDSGGNEISITNYHNKSWDGFLRFIGKDASESTTETKVPTAPRVKVETVTNTNSNNNTTNTNENENTNSNENTNNNGQNNSIPDDKGKVIV